MYANSEDELVCPWGNAPLIDCFTGDIGVISIAARNVEVIPFLLRRAGALALTVIDEQAAKIHRPATFCITLDSVQKNVDRNAMVLKLVPLLKREADDVLELLATPRAVLKRRLDHVTAQRFVQTLDLVGCNCNIEKEMPDLGVTIPISGPGVVEPRVHLGPSAQDASYDSRGPNDKDVSLQPCWVMRVWDKMAKRRQYY